MRYINLDEPNPPEPPMRSLPMYTTRLVPEVFGESDKLYVVEGHQRVYLTPVTEGKPAFEFPVGDCKWVEAASFGEKVCCHLVVYGGPRLTLRRSTFSA